MSEPKNLGEVFEQLMINTSTVCLREDVVEIECVDCDSKNCTVRIIMNEIRDLFKREIDAIHKQNRFNSAIDCCCIKSLKKLGEGLI